MCIRDRHKGFPYYTIGQRKRLEIALGHPAYVLRINAEKNTVMLGDAEELKAEDVYKRQMVTMVYRAGDNCISI